MVIKSISLPRSDQNKTWVMVTEAFQMPRLQLHSEVLTLLKSLKKSPSGKKSEFCQRLLWLPHYHQDIIKLIFFREWNWFHHKVFLISLLFCWSFIIWTKYWLWPHSSVCLQLVSPAARTQCSVGFSPDMKSIILSRDAFFHLNAWSCCQSISRVQPSLLHLMLILPLILVFCTCFWSSYQMTLDPE